MGDSMSDIQVRLTNDMKTAMKNKDKDRLATIRMALAALKQVEIDEQVSIDNDLAISTLTKMIKQRKDSAKQYQQANREELAEKELLEISILTEYLPKQLTPAELDALISNAIEQLGASSMKDMGKVMGTVRPKVLGKTDMSLVSQLIKSRLS
ncbi:GatB/YqeY domain-containing protein [Thiotrichales bacterium 19S11-10]|nr:GatB/YqeY domain-containing protein [Thiotrichales bacterium 19S11-10]MCF6807507.1 GatB/YqeY domain-containing protein [Thiotrichales bacterium 19S9-11]MCF6811476.1 GatB/YqeY domain-containing protein [Thiotrichales bacterium 19S9-12]